MYICAFSEDELTSSNVKGKQPKLQFLGKLINFLEVNLDTSMDDVKPAKIVSGLEPERTRYVLQLFTVVVTTKSDTIVDTSATSKSIKKRTESLEGHLISKFAISESNRHAVPAWVSSVIVISASASRISFAYAHTRSFLNHTEAEYTIT